MMHLVIVISIKHSSSNKELLTTPEAGIQASCAVLLIVVPVLICDMIKGNESLVENCNSYFLAPLSHNCNMLHFDANPITIGLVTEL